MDNQVDEDDVPISTLIARKQNVAAVAAPEIDSDDDLPILDFVKKRAAQIAAKEKENNREKEIIKEKEKRKREEVKVEPKKEKSARKERDTEITSERTSTRSNPTNKSAAFYAQTEKGRLVQAFLIRWWYAYEWPRPEDTSTPPPGYEALDGFRGVFVSTRADSLGKILDLRDQSRCPCLSNFASEPSERLKSLCITAIENQLAQLQKVEGDHGKLQKILKAELHEIRKIDPAKADKQAREYDGCFTRSVAAAL